ncbi:EAL domain-containing protein [Pseudofrankia asymbiotica]|uniref:sensor domain-containing phosphodiesterase n=1 Tax=Pseudofrankia asymbiotica TaxID=1834516 RepID=UPI001F517002|nr:EAL domain-containing protein [Pseudofrankia asymbiotica]
MVERSDCHGAGQSFGVGPDPPGETTRRILSVARQHLDMELSCLSRSAGEALMVEVTEGDSRSFGLVPGIVVDDPESMCGKLRDGRLPPVMSDVRSDRRTAGDPAAGEQGTEPGIGAIVTAPVRRADGQIYGLLTCLSHDADHRLGEKDGSFLSQLASALSYSVTEPGATRQGHDRRHCRIRGLVDGGGPRMVFQPVFNLATMRLVGAEALARFPPGFGSPERWFADAVSVGLGTELELAAISAALRVLPRIPDGLTVAVNASPATVASGRLATLLADKPAGRIIVEITEHERVEDYPATRAALDHLRAQGVRTAVDDVGVGYAGLHHLVELLPDVIKMDRRLTHRIDADRNLHALAVALTRFAGDIGACVLAEGVETAAELRCLISAGVHQAQGYYLGAPGPLPSPVPSPAPPPAPAAMS